MRLLKFIMASAALWVWNRVEGAVWSPSRSNISHSRQSAKFEFNSGVRCEVVRKSQYLEENSFILNRLVDLFELYTVGTGLQLMPASKLDPEWNKAAKAWLDEWSHYCDNNSLQSFGTIQGLMARKWFVDGELFIPLVNGESNRPRIQLVEEHLVATPPDLKSREGESIIDGVQIDKRGRPIGYYIAEEDGKGRKTWGPAKPANMVIHLFEPSRPGQYRGMPFVYPVINPLHQLDDLLILEMKRAADQAEITRFFKTKTGEIPNAEALLKLKYGQSRELSTGASVTETREKWYQDAIGGRNIALFQGDEVFQEDNKNPSAATQWFWRELKEQVCAGIGIPYLFCFPGNTDVKGTDYRGALDMAAQFFRVRSTVIQDVLRRIYQTHVMRWAVQNVPELRPAPADWKNVSIRPPRAPNVDVGRNMTAELASLAAGTTNLDLIFGPAGLDWREETDKLAEQLTYLKDKGVLGLLGELANAQKPQPQNPPNGSANGYPAARLQLT